MVPMWLGCTKGLCQYVVDVRKLCDLGVCCGYVSCIIKSVAKSWQYSSYVESGTRSPTHWAAESFLRCCNDIEDLSLLQRLVGIHMVNSTYTQVPYIVEA